MLAFLTEPLAKYGAALVVVFSLVVGAAIYVHSVRVAGIAEGEAADASVSAKRAETVMQNSSRIDQTIWQDKDPQAELRKDWERPK